MKRVLQESRVVCKWQDKCCVSSLGARGDGQSVKQVNAPSDPRLDRDLSTLNILRSTFLSASHEHCCESSRAQSDVQVRERKSHSIQKDAGTVDTLHSRIRYPGTGISRPVQRSSPGCALSRDKTSYHTSIQDSGANNE